MSKPSAIVFDIMPTGPNYPATHLTGAGSPEAQSCTAAATLFHIRPTSD
ncbi:MAG: hypothetical protein ABSF69_22630 [Polyangiaceae bacterium]|jgi:hypothetical protein